MCCEIVEAVPHGGKEIYVRTGTVPLPTLQLIQETLLLLIVPDSITQCVTPSQDDIFGSKTWSKHSHLAK